MPTMYPYLSYRDAASALRFLEEAFGFTTNVRWDAPMGRLQHAEATFGDGALMMGTAEHPTAPLEGARRGSRHLRLRCGRGRALRAGKGGRGSGGVPAGGYRVEDAPLSGARP